MPEDTTHECPKNGCHARVRRSQPVCPAHWRLVPVPVQRELYAAYRSGNLGRHVAAMQDCIEHVNHGEPRIPESRKLRRLSPRLVSMTGDEGGNNGEVEVVATGYGAVVVTVRPFRGSVNAQAFFTAREATTFARMVLQASEEAQGG